MKAFKDWATGSGVVLSIVKIKESLLKKFYMIASKILMYFAMSGMCKLSIRLSLFHVCLFL
jgi:hypothetical protein